MVEDILADLDIKARSLLVTIWGDCIAPHGRTVWLGSLIELVSCLGLNERAVRTSVFRLKNEKILVSSQKGRKSFYTLTGSGQLRFEEATKRIYSHLPEAWDGKWTLLFTGRREMKSSLKKKLYSELHWLGYGDLGSGILAHPRGNVSSIQHLLEDLGVEDQVAVMQAASIAAPEKTPAHIMVKKGWNLEEIESGYKDFIESFAPVLNQIKNEQTISSKTAFLLRILAVHDYRRALLQDPRLPDRLLPEGWAGADARQLFHDIYQLIWRDAESYLTQILETEEGQLPEASKEFLSRFGGLK
ncbi:phenylacetic acid degradation operon negative regulatory protein PaaX [Sneathiella sp. P13V-1]|uniref:phenylacetic acid degradation operon negative regulatory protein PaaX n=1 Tax=Sneathiella sp. P13V-1 TaxID=2697366 RepID=UPI00187B157E|nr:phenylacetic acid degradation operon negative regulatory protein PaaX [Sneathiella sp. P13V-1]MBE7637036.1 phenylacetic acid degradation operon negative regulatory protein PaaX [Sneathiella sp. P13V-1]